MSNQPDPATRRPIQPFPPRWKPAANPADIVVPGLDSSASVTDQIEQIEQLITIKLQNIDENFSKIHNLLANKLLPAVKRYAVGSEPVREAAKFWTSFYEQAAQIRIPTYEEYSSVNEAFFENEHEGTLTQDSPHPDIPAQSSATYMAEESVASAESSFMPSQALFSSTPAITHRNRIANPINNVGNQTSDTPSWSASMESPLVRLDRELQNFSAEDDDPGFTPISLKRPDFQPNVTEQSLDDSEYTSYVSSTDKGKSKDSGSLLRNVLEQQLYSKGDVLSSGRGFTSPLKVKKVKTPVPKGINPFLPPDTQPSEWDGLVDLTDPYLGTPLRGRYNSNYPATPDRPSEDESFEGLPPGMSPPVLMSPARPPRSMAELGLSKTPRSEAAVRITRDLVSDFRRQGAYSGQRERSYGYSYNDGAIESSLSTVQSIPSMSRYAPHDIDTSSSIVGDSSLESMMRRIGLNYPSSSTTPSTIHDTPAVEPSSPRHEPVTPDPAGFYVADEHVDDMHDSDSDDDDVVNNTAHPSAAFLMASQGLSGSTDDSFNSDHSGDSFIEDNVQGLEPVNPFAGVVDNGFDDSFDDDSFLQQGGGGETETVFGVPPMQREQMAASRSNNQFRVMGEDLLEDTMGFTAQFPGTGGVDESPTPAYWPSASRE